MHGRHAEMINRPIPQSQQGSCRMKWLSLLPALALLVLWHGTAPARAEEGCVRPLGGPCIDGPDKPGSGLRTCKTRLRSCKVNLAVGASCTCKGAKGTVR